MAACERCWTDAFTASRLRGTSQADEYHRLVAEREGDPACLALAPHGGTEEDELPNGGGA